jgi:glycosyltransferase involved in cell wall biosynthesis
LTLPIAVNGRFLSRAPTGVDRFAGELLREWARADAGKKDIRIVVPAGNVETVAAFEDVPVEPVGRLKGHMWEQIELRAHCSREFLISLCNTSSMSHPAQLVVLHDAAIMAFPSTYSFAFRNWYRLLHYQLMRRVGTIATVSEFSASELRKHYKSNRQDIEVIYESGEHILRVAPDREILKRIGVLDEPYVLVVGSQSPNKNFANVLKAIELLGDVRIRVVAVGGTNKRIFADVDRRDTGLVSAGYVTDGELRALYEGAQCFLFPSLYEGFGLPPLEAMQCGCPTLVSRRAALPEVCGDAAAYCDPSDPADIARQLQVILDSGALRDELRRAGLARSKMFSWKKAAAQFEDIILQKASRG